MHTITSRHLRSLAAIAILSITVGACGQADAQFSGDAPSATEPSKKVYVAEGGHVTVLDASNGEVLHELEPNLALQSYFLAVHPDTNRLFVTEAKVDGETAHEYLTVYRTTDWSIEHQVAVPDIIRYLSDGTGIAPSRDGRFVYVYNYNDRTRGDEPVRYWLTVFDLASGSWIGPEIELPNCGTSELIPAEAATLYVLCHDTDDIRVVNTTTFAIDKTAPVEIVEQGISAGRGAKVAAAAIAGNTVYVVSENREIHTMNLTDGKREVRTIATGTSPARTVPFEPVGIDMTENRLFVPTGTPDERSQGLSSSIAIIDLSTGTELQSVRISERYRAITFADDGSAAFLTVVDDTGFGKALVRVDLRTGTETHLFTGPVSSQVVVE